MGGGVDQVLAEDIIAAGDAAGPFAARGGTLEFLRGQGMDQADVFIIQRPQHLLLVRHQAGPVIGFEPAVRITARLGGDGTAFLPPYPGRPGVVAAVIQDHPRPLADAAYRHHLCDLFQWRHHQGQHVPLIAEFIEDVDEDTAGDMALIVFIPAADEAVFIVGDLHADGTVQNTQVRVVQMLLQPVSVQQRSG